MSFGPYDDCPDGEYRARNGDCVPDPNSSNSDLPAICQDGSHSHNEHPFGAPPTGTAALLRYVRAVPCRDSALTSAEAGRAISDTTRMNIGAVQHDWRSVWWLLVRLSGGWCAGVAAIRRRAGVPLRSPRRQDEGAV
jgi:hypothetical protein